MKPSSSVAGVFAFIAAGCGAGPAATGGSGARAAPPHTAIAPRSALDETRRNERPPSLEAHGSTDRARGNELGAPATDDGFAVARQVTALERAIELYQTFIERAGDDPRYAEAVRRSKSRIEDARLTICFLLEKSCDGSESR